MNKFIHPPDSLAGLAGCVLWIGVLAGLLALLFTTLSRIAG
ncbi:MAG TPA: hypothetical protein VKW04_09160 [Planctomycetota bacterium]|nr:hypothetical protein [Planctomycetota bacterium]